MTTRDNHFIAEGALEFTTAFVVNSTDPYVWGVEAYGSNGGVVGCGGTPITRLLGPYSTFAGVHGTSSDFTGVAGTSVNHVGVYGQVEDNIHLPDNFHAGVLGAAGNQPGDRVFGRKRRRPGLLV
jgi:hypothetical protein